MPKNALLLRWKGGYATKTDGTSIGDYGRREAFLSAATVDSAASIESTGAAALSLFSQPRVSTTAAWEPQSDAEAPYLAVNPGDYLTVPNSSGVGITARVEALTVTEDDNGYLSYTGEFQNLVETERRRQATWLSRVGTGALGGRSAAASLLEQVDPETGGSGRINTRDVVFSKGVLEVSTSPALLVAKSSRLTMIQATIVPGATSPAITFRILKNGSALSFAPVGGSAATSFSLTPSVARLVLLPSAGDIVVAESDTIAIDLTAVAADANLFGMTATLADLF